MKVYISGRIKDYDGYVGHFKRVHDYLEAIGHEIVNPCELTAEQLSYEEFMKLDIIEMLKCDAICMLKGWETSSGARCEHLIAAMCGMKFMYEESL